MLKVETTANNLHKFHTVNRTNFCNLFLFFTVFSNNSHNIYVVIFSIHIN